MDYSEYSLYFIVFGLYFWGVSTGFWGIGENHTQHALARMYIRAKKRKRPVYCTPFVKWSLIHLQERTYQVAKEDTSIPRDISKELARLFAKKNPHSPRELEIISWELRTLESMKEMMKLPLQDPLWDAFMVYQIGFRFEPFLYGHKCCWYVYNILMENGLPDEYAHRFALDERRDKTYYEDCVLSWMRTSGNIIDE